MALPAVDTEARLLTLIAAAEPRLKRALTTAITAARTQSTLDQLVVLIEQGRLEEALGVAIRTGSIRLADEATAVFVLAGNEGALFLTDVLEVMVGFDQVNDRAVRAMVRNRLRLITNFTAQQRAATRAALVDGIRRGLNPRQQALAFRNSIGLSERGQAAVTNFRRLLETGSSDALSRELRDRRFDTTVRHSIRVGEPLTPEQVDRMVGRYSERQVAYRANVIARTEALRSVHEGTDESFRQAIDGGFISTDQLQRRWVTAADERVRGSHVRLNGLVRGIDETFPADDGPLRFPGDASASAAETVQCRCVLSTRIDVP